MSQHPRPRPVPAPCADDGPLVIDCATCVGPAFGACADCVVTYLLGRQPDTLSGGEARRVGIGRALLSRPDFLLLDEPLSSLDPARREELIGMIETIRDRTVIPILFVSHQADEVARLAGHVVAIGNDAATGDDAGDHPRR